MQTQTFTSLTPCRLTSPAAILRPAPQQTPRGPDNPADDFYRIAIINCFSSRSVSGEAVSRLLQADLEFLSQRLLRENAVVAVAGNVTTCISTAILCFH